MLLWMRRLAPFGIELYLLLCDSWAAAALPSSFARYPSMFAVMVDVLRYERRLQWVAVIGAALIGFGLLLLAAPAEASRRASVVMRACGLGVSGMLWVGLAGSFLSVVPETLSGVPYLLMGLGAWIMVLRWPRLPDRVL